MEKIELTKTVVEKLSYADKGKQVDYYDCDLDGFGIRIPAQPTPRLIHPDLPGELFDVYDLNPC